MPLSGGQAGGSTTVQFTTQESPMHRNQRSEYTVPNVKIHTICYQIANIHCNPRRRLRFIGDSCSINCTVHENFETINEPTEMFSSTKTPLEAETLQLGSYHRDLDSLEQANEGH